jgi:hypothetical protein
MNRDQIPVIEGSDVFDEYRDECVQAVVPAEIAGPVQELLLALRQFKQTRDSFGVDAKMALDLVIPDIEKLRAGCLERWRNL